MIVASRPKGHFDHMAALVPEIMDDSTFYLYIYLFIYLLVPENAGS
jgi:hypothetical protein